MKLSGERQLYRLVELRLLVRSADLPGADSAAHLNSIIYTPREIKLGVRKGHLRRSAPHKKGDLGYTKSDAKGSGEAGLVLLKLVFIQRAN